MTKRRGRPKESDCILCGKKIKKDDKKFCVAMEKPIRLDIIVHRECYQKTSENELKTAIKENFMV
jgi:hypothetical protein